jgi:hypothetical protein
MIITVNNRGVSMSVSAVQEKVMNDNYDNQTE